LLAVLQPYDWQRMHIEQRSTIEDHHAQPP